MNRKKEVNKQHNDKKHYRENHQLQVFHQPLHQIPIPRTYRKCKPEIWYFITFPVPLIIFTSKIKWHLGDLNINKKEKLTAMLAVQETSPASFSALQIISPICFSASKLFIIKVEVLSVVIILISSSFFISSPLMYHRRLGFGSPVKTTWKI